MVDKVFHQAKDEQVVWTKVESHQELCVPIVSLKELKSWKPDKNVMWPRRVVKKQINAPYKIKGYSRNCHRTQGTFSSFPRIIGHTVPKTLVCHDYKGGYLDDRYPDGSTQTLNYTFFHWAGVDLFVYFSHYFVTIPPLGWLNAAHRNGVSVLGTLITENDPGTTIWKEILSDDDVQKLVVKKLVEVADYFHFDGYLLNIENEFPIEFNYNMVKFIKSLKQGLRNTLGADSTVIWYDSVTFQGKLKWQNKLNDSNKKFFDACDGIFLNYLWKPDELFMTAAAAGARQHNVYVGIDVFGRGCFEGGGFNTDKALQKIRDAGLSVAIFAPAWTHECAPNVRLQMWREIFFWQRLWKYLYIHGPGQLPFSTSFCVGRGFKKYFRGRVTMNSGWYNLADQEMQISVPYCTTETDCEDLESFSARCIRHFEKEAFSGGNCLIVSRPNGLSPSQHCFNRLFCCEFWSTKPLEIALSTKSLDNNVSSLSLVLLLEDSHGTLKREILAPDAAYKVLAGQSDTVGHIRNLFTDPSVRVCRISRPVVIDENDWATNEFLVTLENFRIMEIGVLHLGVCAVLLGKLAINLQLKE